MRQYEVWWASLPPPVGRRLVLLLSRNSAYAVLNKVIVAVIIEEVLTFPSARDAVPNRLARGHRRPAGVPAARPLRPWIIPLTAATTTLSPARSSAALSSADRYSS